MDGFAALRLGVAAMMYQLFDGADPEEYDVTIKVQDEESGEVFNEINYPEALEE